MPLLGAARQSDFLNWAQKIVDAEPWRSPISSSSIPRNSSSGLSNSHSSSVSKPKDIFVNLIIPEKTVAEILTRG